jgi:hypothetical protein
MKRKDAQEDLSFSLTISSRGKLLRREWPEMMERRGCVEESGYKRMAEQE